MKKKYTLKRLCLATVLGLSTCFAMIGQNLNFTFENVNNTFDGTDWWYNADIYIATTGGLADFRLGSGQIYFNYNTAAFGTNVYDVNNQATDNFDFLQPVGSILGSGFYNPFITNNNTPSRVSTAFQQAIARGEMTTDQEVTSTPKHIYSIRFRYIDITESPDVEIEDIETNIPQVADQFFTACGPDTQSSGPIPTFANCTNFPGNQLLGSTFDSTAATDTMVPVISLIGADPQEINLNDPYVELGATSDDGGTVTINSSAVNTNSAGDYDVFYNYTDIAGNVATELVRTVSVIDQTLSIEGQFDSELSVAVYPNPVVNILNIDADFDTAELYDITGTLVATTNSKEMNVSKIAGGVYLLKVTAANGAKMVKVIKK